MKEKDLEIIELKGLSAHTMELILNCIYTDQVVFTTENVLEILPAASLLQLSGNYLLFFKFNINSSMSRYSNCWS